MTKLLSNQIDERELDIILRELRRTIDDGVAGDVVEFGCYVGTASVPMGKLMAPTGRTLYLYDSFEGLPEKTREDESPVGLQFQTGELKATKRALMTNLAKAGVTRAHVKKAWFSELTADDVPHRIAFAYLDGDYYKSVKDPLALITPYLAPHATVLVDDYANEALPGAAKAVDEWVGRHGYKVRIEHSLAIIRL